jgi:hypothetical protein
MEISAQIPSGSRSTYIVQCVFGEIGKWWSCFLMSYELLRKPWKSYTYEGHSFVLMEHLNVVLEISHMDRQIPP